MGSLVLALALAACASRRTDPDALEALAAAKEPASFPKLDLDVERVATELPPQDLTYRVGINDVLYVEVPGHPEFGGGRVTVDGRPLGVRVADNGSLHLPLIGEVPAAGKTVREVRASLEEKIAEFVKRPAVFVQMLKYESQKFYVLGAFARPGVFAVDGDTTLLEGIGLAGGVLEGGDLEGAFVVRGETLLPLSLADLLLRGDTSRNIYMKHGDLVYVPPAVRWRVYVLGEVRKPGPVAIPQAYGLTLAGAIAAAGDLDPLHADKREIRLFRGSWQAPEAYTLGFEDLLRYGDAIRLRPGDRIHVAPRGLATWSRTMQLLLPFLEPAISGVTAAAILDD